jgi:hypothetical protein
MLREGYSKEDIDKVFAPQSYDMRSWYLVFAIIIAIVGVYVSSKGGGVLPLIFSMLLFVQYFRECERLKKKPANDEEEHIDEKIEH